MYERFNTYSTTRPRLRKTVGWVFIVIGVAGVVAPVLPGAPLVYVGLELLGLRIIFTDKFKRSFSRRKYIDVDALPSLDAVTPQETRP